MTEMFATDVVTVMHYAPANNCFLGWVTDARQGLSSLMQACFGPQGPLSQDCRTESPASTALTEPPHRGPTTWRALCKGRYLQNLSVFSPSPQGQNTSFPSKHQPLAPLHPT